MEPLCIGGCTHIEHGVGGFLRNDFSWIAVSGGRVVVVSLIVEHSRQSRTH
jgi:hypothetical protein